MGGGWIVMLSMGKHKSHSEKHDLDKCEFDSYCLMHMEIKVLNNMKVCMHLLPMFPALTVALMVEGKWFDINGGRFDFCIDYDWFLWLAFESGLME